MILPPEVRDSPLGSYVLVEFERRCDQMLQKMLDKTKVNDSTVIEVEARLGLISEHNKHFVPGVSRKFFQQMRDYFVKKATKSEWTMADNRQERVRYKHTDYVDVVFEDETRVTCKLIRIENSPKLENVEIVEVMRKKKLGSKPVDYAIDSRINYHLRVGVASEEMLKNSTDSYKAHASSAKKVLLDAFNVSSRIKITGGIDLTIKKEAEVFLYCPPDEEQFARGLLGFQDPFYREGSRNDWRLSGKYVHQLKWTMLNPSRLPALGGNPNVELRDKVGLDKLFFVTNLPGMVELPDGTKYMAYSCQYIVQVKLADIFCGYGRFANAGDADDYTALPVKLFRHKTRWSFELRHGQTLDMTQTQQSSNPVTLFHETSRYEVELERVLDAKTLHSSNLKAVAFADSFLSDIMSRIYGTALSPIDAHNLESDEWNRHHVKDLERVRTFELANKKSITTNTADQSDAADFYNKLNRSSVHARSDSLIYHMRCLNNYVKSVALKSVVQKVSQETRGISVLDLACGKGADFQKIVRAAKESNNIRIDQYVGVDIARVSLADAVERLTSMREKLECRVRFLEADLGNTPLSDDPSDLNSTKLLEVWDSDTKDWNEITASEMLGDNERFDLISMQFAMHYMFQTRDRLNRFFKTISKHMNTGGIFLATTVHSDEMLHRLMSSGASKSEFSIFDNFGVEACNVKFDPDFRSKYFNGADDSMIGLRYLFTLRDGDGTEAVAAPEWLVPLDLLKHVATMYNFSLTSYQRLPNYASSTLTDSNALQLMQRMNVLNHEGTISDVEWDIASLYVVLELQKEETPLDHISALRKLKQRLPEFDTFDESEREVMLSTMLQS